MDLIIFDYLNPLILLFFLEAQFCLLFGEPLTEGYWILPTRTLIVSV